MSERTYLSIGEVLASLKEDFDDITISKIRFLESQGLIDPERTPSGYRKFYEQDIARLRWILRQQKDHFLPLKVIKDRLASGDVDLDDPASAAGAEVVAAETPAKAPTHRRHRPVDDHQGALGLDVPEPVEAAAVAAPAPEEPARQAPVVEAVAVAEPLEEPAEPVRAPVPPRLPPPVRDLPAAPSPPALPPAPPRRVAPPFPASLRRTATGPEPADTGNGRARSSPAAFLTAPEPASRRVRVSPPPARPLADAPSPRALDRAADAFDALDALDDDQLGQVELSLEELCAAAAISSEQVADLERFGLLEAATGRLGRSYDVADLEVARLAAGFARFGVEARHLRIWKTAAEREVAFFEQVVTPLLKQRNPNARRQAEETLAELARLGQQLHGALLRAALDEQ